MSANANRENPRPLLIAGRVANAAELALRRILRAKQRDQSLVVVDYQGTLAPVLTERSKGNLHKGPLLWCDLANRWRPTALFRFKRSPGMKPALRGFLESGVRYAAISVSAATIEVAVDLAYRLVDLGSVGLAALVRSLRRPETSHALRRDQDRAGEIDRLIEWLDWTLRFPAVWGLSEGNNCVDLGDTFSLGGTTWIELPAPHFERAEHQVAAWMVDAALTDALLSGNGGTSGDEAGRHPTTLLYGFPAASPLPLTAGAGAAKHVGLFTFSATHPLPGAARPWFDCGADCWIIGDVGAIPTTGNTAWLDATERKRLCDLQSGQVWARSGINRKAVTVLVRPPELQGFLARGFRRQAVKRLRLTPVKQFSSASTNLDAPAPPNTDLYRKLCLRETLLTVFSNSGMSLERKGKGCREEG